MGPFLRSIDKMLDEELINKNVANLITVARLRSGLTQADLADRIGVPQGTVSKWESNTLQLDSSKWFLMANILGVDLDAPCFGYIDGLNPVGRRAGKKEGGFKLPSRYQKDRVIKVRSLVPLLSASYKIAGEDFMSKFLNGTLEIEPLFFLNFDNQINFTFVLDIIYMLSNDFKVSAELLQDLILDFSEHGKLNEIYLGHRSPITNLTNFVKKTKYYDKFFTYETVAQDKDKFIFTATPFMQIQADELQVRDLLRNYFLGFFSGIASTSKSGRHDFLLTKETCSFTGDKLCTYVVSV